MTEKEFLELLPNIREAARACGYAIGLHGSLKRDFDIIAVPWTEEANSADDLAFAVYAAAGGKRWRLLWWEGSQKPHGRRAYAFDWGETNKNRDYCDLSVMPLLTAIDDFKKRAVEDLKYIHQLEKEGEQGSDERIRLQGEIERLKKLADELKLERDVAVLQLEERGEGDE